MKRILTNLTFTCLALAAFTIQAETLEEILAMDEAPTGVVIEVIEPGAKALDETLTNISSAKDRIRQRFPELPIAVVSHGVEQFFLTTRNIEKNQELKSNVQQLVSNDVDLHVCGTHASWRDVEPEDYPDYIDVSPAGPAQINDYLKLGYIMLDL